MAAVQKANTIKDLEAVSESIYGHGEAIKLLVSKWSNLCNTVEEIEKALSFAARKLNCNSKEYKMTWSRLESILFVEIPKAQDIKTIKWYYYSAPLESALRLLALERWLEICKTPEEANEAFKALPKEKEACRLAAYIRTKELALKSL